MWLYLHLPSLDVFIFNSISVSGHSTLASVMTMEEDEYLLLFSKCLFEDNNGGGDGEFFL